MVFSNDIPFPRSQSSLSNFCICFLLRANHDSFSLFFWIKGIARQANITTNKNHNPTNKNYNPWVAIFVCAYIGLPEKMGEKGF
ncbi:hypothetical protein HanXRQr2_Chr05g0209511 [Helianthus annuus]|uniref:Uncharacterized protein n=1 Tax=Helianthus annuus TaxID=4232 RepID=A0A9K3IYB5_HELAN|nr:hypothetical protein HanXRQr2_Chr05g0209511 [Helianthus annuus]KAJ0922332.1 hypothetical protein HanPSC8_Chr05g0202561 [Helianthus annuus]